MFIFYVALLFICFTKCNSSQELVKVGDFKNHFHDIVGEVFIKDNETLVIKGFGYDGTGPDTLFLGKSLLELLVTTLLPD